MSTRWLRSPSDTARTTCAIAVVGSTSESISELAADTPLAHEPFPVPGTSRSSTRPSLRTSLRTLASSPLKCPARSWAWLKTSAIFESTSSSPAGSSRTSKSPSRSAVTASRIVSRSASL
jgi:hypothetical protein